MDQLLTLLTVEKAKELQFRAGSAPIVVSDNDQRPLQGPPITNDDVLRFLHAMASSRHMRILRESGTVRFIYSTRGRSPFLIRASIEDETVMFSVS